MTDPDHIAVSRRTLAKVATAALNELPTAERILVCEGIASLYPAESNEAVAARAHAQALRDVERQQLCLSDLFNC